MIAGCQGEARSALGSAPHEPHCPTRSLISPCLGPLYTRRQDSFLPDKKCTYKDPFEQSPAPNMATVAAAVGAAHLVGYLDARWRLADDLRVVAGAAKVKVKLDKCNKQ